MRISSLCKFFGLFIVLSNFNISHAQTRKAKFTKAIIEYESFITATSEAVKCQYFESVFKQTIKTIVVNDQKKVDSLAIEITKMKPASSQKSIDVRLRFILCNGHSKVEYCMDRFGIFLDNRGRYFQCKLLYDFIISQIPGGGW